MRQSLLDRYPHLRQSRNKPLCQGLPFFQGHWILIDIYYHPNSWSEQGWKNTNTYWANTGVRSCSPEHERTRTRIFQKLLNTNEHELGKFINYRTRTNTNTKLKVGEQRTRNRTPNTWTPNVFAPVRRVRRFKTVRTFRRSDCVKSPRFAQNYSWNPKCSLFSLLTMFDLVNSCC